MPIAFDVKKAQRLKMKATPLLPLHRAPALPPPALLRELVGELEQAPRDASAPKILAALPLPAAPEPLGLCREVSLVHYTPPSFVLSQRRRPRTQGYVYVCDKREMCKGRRPAPWPRLATGRKRLVALHRWILTATRGPPPSKAYVATHVCGNDKCILAAHLRWQKRLANLEDEDFHRKWNSAVGTRSKGRLRYSERSWDA